MVEKRNGLAREDTTSPAAAKKRILYIVESMGGGVFTYIVGLSNELVNDYDMYIAYAVRPQTPPNYREYFDERIHLIEIKNFGRAINVRQDLKSLSEVRAVARQVQPDVIHLHSSKAGAIGRVALDDLGIPLFYTPHGYSFLMENFRPMKRRLFLLVETVCAKLHCTTISCSEGEHQETLKLTKRAYYVNNGINIDDMQRMMDSVPPAPAQPFTVYTLGRISWQKDPELFNRIAEACPDVRFLWIGDGVLRESLTAPNITITGWTERNQALQHSLPADAFLLTSSWEGLPMSLLESMYMRKPCIVSNVIGNRDVIKNGRNGFVCNELEDYVAAIERIRTASENARSMPDEDYAAALQKADPELADMVENAYNDILTTYNTRVMAAQYSEIYREAMNNADTARRKAGNMTNGQVGGVPRELINISGAAAGSDDHYDTQIITCSAFTQTPDRREAA